MYKLKHNINPPVTFLPTEEEEANMCSEIKAIPMSLYRKQILLSILFPIVEPNFEIEK